MAFPDSPLRTFLSGFFVSTYCTHKSGFKTMVFPSGPDAKIVTGGFADQVDDVDFRHPCEEYTQHYATVDEAKAGHKATIKTIKELIKKKGNDCKEDF